MNISIVFYFADPEKPCLDFCIPYFHYFFFSLAGRTEHRNNEAVVLARAEVESFHWMTLLFLVNLITASKMFNCN